MDIEELLAQQISTAVNSFSFDSQKFCESMIREHRTLQQSFMRWVILPWLEYLAEAPDYMFDDRNKATQEIAKELKKVIEGNKCLPFI